LFRYYNNITEDIKIKIRTEKISDYEFKQVFFMDSIRGTKVIQRNNDYMSSIWKTNFLECKPFQRDDYAYLFIECPGIIEETLHMEINEKYDKEISISVEKINYSIMEESILDNKFKNKNMEEIVDTSNKVLLKELITLKTSLNIKEFESMIIIEEKSKLNFSKFLTNYKNGIVCVKLPLNVQSNNINGFTRKTTEDYTKN